LADTGMGDEKVTCCQPDAVSFVNVALPNKAPDVDQIFPTCVPVFVLAL
jgi:hypothetical protein